jgi:hypothetical protein
LNRFDDVIDLARVALVHLYQCFAIALAFFSSHDLSLFDKTLDGKGWPLRPPRNQGPCAKPVPEKDEWPGPSSQALPFLSSSRPRWRIAGGKRLARRLSNQFFFVRMVAAVFAVNQPGHSRLMGAVGTAVNRTVVFDSVTDYVAPAVRTCGSQCMNRTLERIEHVLLAALHNRE